MIFITPVNDIDLHSNDALCKCHPKVVIENGETIIIHNSFDGREAVEFANEILNN